MNLNRHRGMSLEVMSNVVPPSDDQSASLAGVATANTGLIEGNNLDPTDTLAHYSLGPC